MSSCNGNCSDCNKDCAERDFKVKLNPLSEVAKVYAVVSGKGGVGKSSVTAMLASEMARRGHTVAILDADVTGPSVPKAFGLKEKAMGDGQYIYPVLSAGGVKIMSVNLLLENDTDPVVWRAPVITGAVTQFWDSVVWGAVDYMFIDMPPGTGDVPLTVFQSLPVDGIVVVTSPQELVSMIVGKAVKMAELMKIPVLGLVENMSYFTCPDCGKKHAVFGDSKIDELAASYGVKTVAKLPIDPSVAATIDRGEADTLNVEAIKPLVSALE